MTTITIACPHCGAKKSGVPSAYLGKKARCKHCGHTFRITPAQSGHQIPKIKISEQIPQGRSNALEEVSQKDSNVSQKDVQTYSDTSSDDSSRLQPASNLSLGIDTQAPPPFPWQSFLRTFKNHTQPIRSMTLTPDGQMILTAYADDTVHLWDLTSERCVLIFDGHHGALAGSCRLPDGRNAVVSILQNALHLWDLATGQRIRTIREAWQSRVNTAAISGDGSLALIGAYQDNRFLLRVWDVPTGGCLRTLDTHSFPVATSAITPDGHIAIAASAHNTLKAWNTSTGEIVSTLQQVGSGQHVAITRDGMQAVTTGPDLRLHQWDLTSGSRIRTFEEQIGTGAGTPLNPRAGATGMIITLDGCFVLSALGAALEVWNLESGQKLKERDILDTVPAKTVAPAVVSEENRSSPEATIVAETVPVSTAAAAEETQPAHPEAAVAAEPPPTQPDVPAIWKVGDVIINQYAVKAIHEGGGMGLVYRVRHQQWNLDLAVKSPRPNFFATEQQQETFIRECETWIQLGLHPHIVNCFYVRRLGGIPRIFAEYVEGGSLKDWIASGRLYEGTPADVLPRILDIAIQFAWGLHFAHEKGLIHQDVKPANVMMTPDGTAKVTDFGLANARAAVENVGRAGNQQSILVSTGGMTPAYCSPEQAHKQSLSRRTDIWSWAVSVLEMLMGEVIWPSGVAAGMGFDAYLEMGQETFKTALPDSLAVLLRQCFREDPDERPQTMQEVSSRLQEIYRQVTDTPYPRVAIPEAELLADHLNNRAVSLLDLGQQANAEILFAEALQRDAHHVEATYNRNLLLWRSARLTDQELVTLLEEVRTTHQANWHDEYYLAQVHLERGDIAAAIPLLEEALQIAPETGDLRRILQTARHGHTPDAARSVICEGHTKEITAVAFCPDGRRAVSSSWDGTIRLWDVSTGACLRTFKTVREGLDFLSSSVADVSISSDGHRIISGDTNGELRVWNVNSGECLQTLTNLRVKVGISGLKSPNSINTVSISPDGTLVLADGHDDRRIRVWNLTTGACLREFAGHKDTISGACFTQDGKRILSGSHDCTVRLWDLTSGQCLRTFEGHAAIVWSVAADSDGKWAVSGSSDATVKLWNLHTGQLERTCTGHTGNVYAVRFTSDGRKIVSAGADKTVRLWDVNNGRCLRTFGGFSDPVRSVAVSPDNQWFLAGGGTAFQGNSDYRLQVQKLEYSTFQGGFAIALPRGAEEIGSIANTVRQAIENARKCLDQGKFSDVIAEIRRARQIQGYERHDELLQLWREAGNHSQRTRFAEGWLVRQFEGYLPHAQSGSIDLETCWGLSCNPSLKSSQPTLNQWNLATGRRITTLETPENVYRSVISPDSRLALVRHSDKLLRLWDLTHGKCLKVFHEHASAVETLAISRDGRLVVSGSIDNTVGLWSLETGQSLKRFIGHTSLVRSVCFSPDGRLALSGSSDNTLRLWDVNSGACLRVFEGHTNYVNSVGFTPDGRLALSGSSDGTLRIWNLSTGGSLRTLQGHSEGVFSVSLSPNGRFVLSGSRDKTIKLWDLATFQCVRTFTGHTDTVNFVGVTPDGRRAISGSWDSTLKLWDLASGQCVRTFEGHIRHVTAVSLSADGKQILSGDEAGYKRLWELETGRCLTKFSASASASLCLLPDGKRALLGGGSMTQAWLECWDLATSERMMDFGHMKDGEAACCLSPDGRWGLSEIWGVHDLKLWELATGRTIRMLSGHTGPTYAVSFSPDGCWAVSSGEDLTVRVWDVRTGNCRLILRGHQQPVLCVTFSPDGRRAISGSRDRTLRVWELATGQCLHTLQGHTDAVTAVSFSPDGRWAFSGSRDKSLRVWELNAGACVRIFEGSPKAITALKISPDGFWALSSSEDEQLRLWQLVWDYESPANSQIYPVSSIYFLSQG